MHISTQAAKQTLLEFDLTSAYGPFTGLSRMERWNRAEAAALDPPPHVRDLLLHYGLDSPYNQPVMSARDGT
jgi:DNA polymerase delta subunit 4